MNEAQIRNADRTLWKEHETCKDPQRRHLIRHEAYKLLHDSRYTRGAKPKSTVPDLPEKWGFRWADELKDSI